jgi:hypothetical protein
MTPATQTNASATTPSAIAATSNRAATRERSPADPAPTERDDDSSPVVAKRLVRRLSLMATRRSTRLSECST